MKNSLKQLLRTPGKALLTVGVCLFVQTSGRIAKVESEFTTIATVEQKPVSTYIEEGYNSCLGAYGNELPVYDRLISPDVLNFPGANYIGEPENRPVYMGNWLGYATPREWNLQHHQYVVVFTPLKDSAGDEPVEAEVLRVHYTNVIFQDIFGTPPDNLWTGDIIPICQHFSQKPMELKKGRMYLASLVWRSCGPHGNPYLGGEFVVYQQPHSTQYNRDGTLRTSESVPAMENLYQEGDMTVLHATADQTFPSFSDPSIGITELGIDPENPMDQTLPNESGWMAWINNIRLQYSLSPVIPTNDLNLLPSFHNGKAKIAQGRAITEEEFETGAKVCLLSDEFVRYFPWYDLNVGSEMSLPLYCSLYNYDAGEQIDERWAYQDKGYLRRFSLLNAEGSLYSPFSNDTYTVVGTYSINMGYQEAGDTELPVDAVVIPARSVTKSDEDNIAYYAPMNAKSTSFRIPNGTAEEFDKKLREAVPEAAELEILYDDNGYTEIMGDLNRSKSIAALLLFAGVGATVSVIVLLLYFFVVKQKKRTAIERSLGMTKRQCKVSLLSGLLILALLAVCVGTALGGTAVTYGDSGENESGTYLTAFSDWKDVTVKAEEEAELPLLPLLTVPAAVWLFTLCLGLLLLNRNLRIDPIYLLSGKLE